MKHFFGGPRHVWLDTFLFSFFPPQNWNEKNKCIFMHRCKYLAWLSALIFILFYIVTQNVLDLYILTIFSYIDNIPSNNISHLIFNQHFNKIVIAQQIESFPYSRGVHCWCGCKMDCMKYRSFFIFPSGGIVIKSHIKFYIIFRAVYFFHRGGTFRAQPIWWTLNCLYLPKDERCLKVFLMYNMSNYVA